MNIKDLQKIDIKDLKDIDWSSFKDRLSSQPNLIVNIIVICVTVVTVFMGVRISTGTSKALKGDLAELQEKTEALDKYKISEKQLREYLKNMPESISENRLIAMLSEIALESGVQIKSLSPTTKKSDKYSRLTSIEITISSENYADIVRFMHKLENSSYLIRIKGVSGSPVKAQQSSRRFGWGGKDQRPRSSGSSVKNDYVELTIEIETVEFKNV